MRDRYVNRVAQPRFTDFGVESTFTRQPSLVDDFYYRESTCPETGKKVYQVSHPLYMLFNQERLDRLGNTAVQQWLKSLESTGNTAVQSILSKVSDDDLLHMVKSRHIQHPCELERYLNALIERADMFNAEVQKVIAEEKAEMEKNGQTSSVKDLEVNE